MCHGEFVLKDDYRTGYYEIRAYTRYMLNRNSEAVFSRVFPIFDKVNADNMLVLYIAEDGTVTEKKFTVNEVVLDRTTTKETIEQALKEFSAFEIQVVLDEKEKTLDEVDEEAKRLKDIFGEDIVIIK